MRRRIAVLGLGYVGLPVAVAFARKGFDVVGFDVDRRRVAELRDGVDRTREVEGADLAQAPVVFTTDVADLRRADFFIVTVPTPITDDRRPDLTMLLSASRTVGQALKPGDIVVYESTVYPGATEEDCVPVLEEASGLKAGRDFTVGYSPERINPGDKERRLETITKVVSGQTPETLEIVAAAYGEIVPAGVHRAPSIRCAEAAKVIENTQRDLNIALMNELALIFSAMGLDTHDVLKAAGTKWNFLPFSPGLVGGHCIGVDPYYLTHKAEQLGVTAQVVLAGRRTNDQMGRHVAAQCLRLAKADGAAPVVAVLGLTFKEDVPDIRNTKVVDIVDALKANGAAVHVCDPEVDPEQARHEYGLELSALDQIPPADAVILATAHRAFVQMGWDGVARLLKDGRGAVLDVKSVLDRATRPPGIELWRL